MTENEKSSKEGIVTFGLIAAVIVFLFSFMVITTIQKKRYQAFIQGYEQQYAQLGDAAVETSGLPGVIKAVVVSSEAPRYDQGGDPSIITWSIVNFRLPGKVRAKSPNEVNLIISFNETDIPVGSYSGGQPAYQKRIDVVMIDAHSNAILGSNSFMGGKPPGSKAGSSPGYGSSPKGAAVKWIKTFLGVG